VTLKTKKQILVTSALPYANGSIHFGHLVEYIQTDIFVRFLRLKGQDVVYMCADDTHGTPVLMKSRSLGISPEELIAKYHEEHQRDFRDFLIHFDYFYSTNSEENRKHSIQIFEKLLEGGHIYTDDVEGYYCENCKMFLADRFVKGGCPNCGAEDQYGDNCEVCGSHYNSTELISPNCATCGNTPVRRESKHYFFRLSDLEPKLLEWTSKTGSLQEETLNSIREWLRNGLKEWDISRDAPYFGFLIPGETDKYFYVWLDAPVGYIATTERFCKESGRDFDSYWHNQDTVIYHFIGKDIVYFHTLFWPAMLMGSGYTIPKSVFVHGFLTVNGEKMSKTRGTFINARTYLDYLDPQYLRYYYATKLTGNSNDIDLNLDDFRDRVNADLVHKIVNLGSRAISMINKHFDSVIGEMNRDGKELYSQIVSRQDEIGRYYEEREFSKVTRSVIYESDLANGYFHENQPWELLKSNPDRAHEICAFAVNVFKYLLTVLKPILPKMALEAENILKLPKQQWDDAGVVMPPAHRIGKFQRLAERVDPKRVKAIVEASRGSEPQKADKEKTKDKSKRHKHISHADFERIDLRVGKILSAEPVEDSHSLYRLVVDIGREVTMFAGIRKHYPDPKALMGKKIPVVANMQPQQIKNFGVSDAMLLAALGPDGQIALPDFPDEVEPGWRLV